MYNNTISGTATEKEGNENIITVYNYMYNNTISGTATTVIILSLPPFSVAVPEIVLLYM
jgi:hypothetical protein